MTLKVISPDNILKPFLAQYLTALPLYQPEKLSKEAIILTIETQLKCMTAGRRITNFETNRTRSGDHQVVNGHVNLTFWCDNARSGSRLVLKMDL